MLLSSKVWKRSEEWKKKKGGSFLGDSYGKESACNGGRPEFDPWVQNIPWRREWLPTPVFLPGEFHGQRSKMMKEEAANEVKQGNVVSWIEKSFKTEE